MPHIPPTLAPTFSTTISESDALFITFEEIALLISFCIELLLLCLLMSELFQETFVSFSLLISILYILMILAGYA